MRAFWTVLLVACSDPGDGSPDAGPAECPVAAPEDGEECDDRIGACTYQGLNRECPPLTGQCRCAEGRWACEPPECSTCSESCNGECCDLDDVCREDADDAGRACGPRGDGSAAAFEACGHQSDCMGVGPICSPVCSSLCCTFACEDPEDCRAGLCANGVCTPED